MARAKEGDVINLNKLSADSLKKMYYLMEHHPTTMEILGLYPAAPIPRIGAGLPPFPTDGMSPADGADYRRTISRIAVYCRIRSQHQTHSTETELGHLRDLLPRWARWY